MLRLTSQAVRRLFSAILLILVVLAPLGAVHAADAPPAADKASQVSPADRADAQQLVKTLQDPAQRDRLITQLKVIAQAEKAVQETDDPGLLTVLSDKIQEFSDELLETLTSLSDLSHMADWIDHQTADPDLRNRWTTTLGKLVFILGGGIVVERLLMFLLRAPRRLIENRQPANRWQAAPLAFVRGLLDLVPLAAFAAAAYGLLTLPAFKLSGPPNMAAVMLISAYAMVRGFLVVARALFMPRASAIRVLPLDDGTAVYLYVWARRLTYTGIWGYFAIQALHLLGLPTSGHHLLLKLLGLLIAALLVILVLQNRQTVASWLRSNKPDDQTNQLDVVRNRLADIWHILACLYVGAAYVIWALQVRGGFEFLIQASVLTVAILALAKLATTGSERLVNRLFAIDPELIGQFPELEVRANRYCTLVGKLLRGLVAAIAVLAVLQSWGANTLAWLTSDMGRHVLSSLVSIAAVLIGALIVWELVNSAIERYLSKNTDKDGNAIERSARARTLLPLLRNLVMIVLVVLVSLIVLSELGVNIAPLLAGAGVVGVAIGFGSQKLVQDVITGAFILFEDTIAVGDSIKVGEHSGSVEAMTIRTIRLRDANGQVHTLPFSSVSTIVNMSRDFSFYNFDIGVSYREDVDEVMGVIKQVGAELKADPDWSASINDEIEVFGLDRFGDSAVMIRGRIKTNPSKQAPVGREFNRRIKQRFDALNIEIPSPVMTVYFGQDKDGNANPLRVVSGLAHTAPPHAPAGAPPAPFTGNRGDYPMGAPAKE